ncbi:O-antigen ligase family protein [Patescibacteria group bacterium]|nr:O-antigen ligase family protein [Patescibacteria group bacterium]
MSTSVKFSRFFLFLAPFAVFIVSPATLFPFIVGKYAFFRLCVDLALIFFVWAWASGKIQVHWKQLKKPLAIGVAIWVAVFLIASIFAYDPWAAFWGNFERGEGGVQLLHLFIFFFLLTVLLRNKEDWKKMLKFMLGAAATVVVYGLLAGTAGFIGPSFALSTRFQGSLGNPDYTGQFMIFAVFFSLYLMLNASPGSSNTKYSILNTRSRYGFLAILFFVVFILSETRGAFLGFAAGAAMVLVYLAFTWPKKRTKAVFIGVLALLVIGLGVFIDFRHSSFIKNLPVVGRFADISVQSGAARIWTWGSALKGIEARPLLGWGPENFSVLFDKYFDTRHFDPTNPSSQTWFDRAHSVFFDYGSETGLLGLAAYLGMFVLYYVQFFKKKEGGGNLVTQALFFAMPIAYLVTGATLFDVLPMYISLFVFLGLSNHELGINHHEHQS